LTGDVSCTYTIEATVGAPGFSLDNNNAAATKVVATWTEYVADADEGFVEYAASSKFPALAMPQTSDINCGSLCPQGELIARVSLTDNVSAYAVMQSLEAKRQEYALYLADATQIVTFNAKIPEQSFIDILQGLPVVQPLAMPDRPSAYTGYIFVGTAGTGQTLTSSQGGYGAPTSGTIYDERADPSTDVSYGYKPYGAVGTGADTDLGVSFDVADASRVMLVTVWSTDVAFDQSTGSTALTLNMGAYAFADLDFTTPAVPDTPVFEGAQVLAASVACLAAAATLF